MSGSGQLLCGAAGFVYCWDGTDWQPLNGEPVQFIQPGEKGFAATQPLFDCDAQMSALEVPLLHRASISVPLPASPKE